MIEERIITLKIPQKPKDCFSLKTFKNCKDCGLYPYSECKEFLWMIFNKFDSKGVFD